LFGTEVTQKATEQKDENHRENKAISPWFSF
jgi:hypothetical protein